ncbi:uncharacterized protein N7511_008911 [Penicillium nucicola]|uniref:uncharacterized protein n=1 Tax=Penicillium nucicola TaxID=1850975 RepID=UPI0025454977|nr:uncharacterized protein N7511_008911 [Penicillium nucicola]KAJ5747215.1 hypothetical protein N7511_008911 [Penicillium nucicola]
MAPVTCLCGGISVAVELDPTDQTQLQLCHCNSCRAVTGLLSSSYYILQHEPALDGLQKYHSKDVSYFFCKTCGAHVFAHSELNHQFFVASGLLAAKDCPKVQRIEHWKESDTGDGGLSTFLAGTQSDIPSCRLRAYDISNSPQNRSQETEDLVATEPAEQSILQARCLCGGIQFYITPPDASSSQASSPWADLLVPYHSGSSSNPDDVKWWLREKDGHTKYLAGTCTCTTCRLSSGFPIQTWSFIPKTNIFNTDGSPLAFDQGTMQQYNSSPGVYREFCRCCGATIFWHCDERPLLIDVSVGLLQANGARAEGWLEWATGRVSFAELAVQHDLLHLLEEGLRLYPGGSERVLGSD